MNLIAVEINKEKGFISVRNNGKGIPIQVHKEHKVWLPELIFGHLLTSSNYNDNQKKVTGGRNGFGAKLANIYSNKFIVETVDRKSGKSYKQVFRKNMSEKEEPIIQSASANDEYTSITFYPDFKRFKMSEFEDDIISLMKKRVYDIAGVTPASVRVKLNG